VVIISSSRRRDNQRVTGRNGFLALLNWPELSPRELAVSYTDERAYFVPESTVYRLLKEQDLIASPSLHGTGAGYG